MIISQMIVSIVMVVAILLQNKSEGLGSLFGGGMSGGESFRTRRGLEKFLHNGTIVLAISFVVLSFLIVKFS